jgi:serine/threonine protein phosphatase PrpC/predicted Ser/Thr protein kinase
MFVAAINKNKPWLETAEAFSSLKRRHMSQLRVSIGQCSDKGLKAINQDFHGVLVPKEPQLSAKGVAVVLADGISSSDVSQEASESSVTGFLADYYCTSEAWSVKKSAQTVLGATNSWLYSQTRQSQYRYDKDRGYVCTLSALIVKSTTAHVFHVGDARVYRLRGDDWEQLTDDHRFWVSQDTSYLSRAMGMDSHLEVDYSAHPLIEGDVFVLATDGVYEFVADKFVRQAIEGSHNDLDKAAKLILEEALEQGSDDNVTVQVVRVDSLPEQDVKSLYHELTELPFPPVLEARMEFDGYLIIRELYASSRSHVLLAVDTQTQQQVVLKTPSVDLRDDPAYLERFLMEEWIAKRVNNAHVLKAVSHTRKRHFTYTVNEFIEGQTLTQWMIDNPKPDIELVRGIVEQIAKGLRAFHRAEMLHQDLRPENIMIDTTGTVKIIDFGSTRVAGIMEMSTPVEHHNLLGTAQYAAPEYFLGENGTVQSDIFSLGVIAYQMLTGRLPYGAKVARCKTRAAQRKLVYETLLDEEREIPAWIDGVIKKAVHPFPEKRYDVLSEFIYDLRHPNQAFISKTKPPLMDRNPVLFWKSVSLILALSIIAILSRC